MSSTIQTQLTGETAEQPTTGGEPDWCDCVWPSDVRREHVTVGRTSTGHPRRKVIERCSDCNGRVN